ncbi:MAG: HEPN domain-containing protein [Coleofasciculus sp. D1-CHI-01]|uniref:HEPN domain-containing protein n=1 Tax=Coleofasciculus sp. D1-CHI-01 TaxID=3068482 RepID=UPI0032F14258
MQSALDQFRISIARVRDLISIHNSVKAQSTPALDLSDILRAALVLAVSALDYYVHEVVILGMLEIHRGQRSEPNPPRNSSQSAFSRFQVSLGGARQERLIAMDIASWLENEIQQSQGSSFLQQSHTVSALLPVISSGILNRLNNASWLEDEVRERLSYQSFQQPEKIADAIRLISDKKLWEEVAQKLGRSAKDVKQQLSAIVDRRNKIAHEADIDPTYNIGSRWNIDESLVSDAVNFVEQVVESIHQIL